MGGESKPSLFAIAADGRPDGAAIERAAPFADEKIIPAGPIRSRSLSHALMSRSSSARSGCVVDRPCLRRATWRTRAFAIDLGQFQAAGFRDAQAVAEQQQHQAAVAGLVARALDGGQQLVHFQAGEVFAPSIVLSHALAGPWQIKGLRAAFGET